MIRVYVYPSDQWGCGHYRMKWPALAVAEPGMTVEVVEPGTRKVQVPVGPDGHVIGEQFPADADVVVFQRPTSLWVTETIPLLQARGVAVVVELDDDLAHISPSNPAYDMLRPTLHHGRQKARNMHTAGNLLAALRDADMVVTSTPGLADRYGGHGRVRVLRNLVPARYLDVVAEPTDPIAIGWGGSLHSHPHDLQTMGHAIAELVRAGATFVTVGDPDGVGKALGLPADPDGPGPVGLDDYPAAIARFGIGLAPLADSRFNRCKSWLKPLEYAAVGVPWVASPLPEYQALHARGCGALAVRPRDWLGVLRRLLADAGLRADRVAAGRAVAAELTIEKGAWQWAEAWAEAVQRRHARPLGARRQVVVARRAGSLASRARRPRKLRA